MTLNDHWGYAEGDENWKSPAEVMNLLLQFRTDGGNLLINVRPKADGTIPEGSVKVLDAVGRVLTRVRVVVDGKELAEKPSGYTKGKWWWHTPSCWLCRRQAGKHTVEIETLPPEKPNDPVGFRLSVLMIGQ